MNPYKAFVEQIETHMKSARELPLGGMMKCPQAEIKADAQKVLLFSPHPDDECILGLLPLRLMREAGMRIINVAVTQGSNKARKAERLEELKNACDFLGWDVVQCLENGLEQINPNTRENDPERWANSVSIITEILRVRQPRIIVIPHSNDWNSTHIGTHWLVKDALQSLENSFSCYVVETEFWSTMDEPNLMVEADAQTLADIIAATSFHVKEVERIPYHLLLPAWMQDNVRRGAELVGGQGEAVPDFVFATLYRLRRWVDGGFTDVLENGRFVSMGDDLT
jgi:LmbE family N-acetylglucosaminyl deacetylase